ncbi:MAG: RNA 2',3'-cyclic phosphodiesterase, partial [Ignavibacteriaceae bacterium]|nr:RNA 2',3'-cyclic phosphodiesterase [Ignavibacteriaceae bacterium]
MIRLFVALKIPGEIKEEIFNYCYAASENPTDVRWEAREKVHLTLKFIGDVKEDLLDQIIDELEFVKNYTTFNCTISKFGFFFRDNLAKILWCNLQTDDFIISLVEELNSRLKKYDIDIEKRKFKGHLTLLRIKNKVSEKFIKSFEEYSFDPIKFNANEIALIQ